MTETLPEYTNGASPNIDVATEPALKNALENDFIYSVQPVPDIADEVEVDSVLTASTEFKKQFSAALVFPEAARRAGRSGAVSLIVGLSATGVVESVRLKASSGSALLDSAARIVAESIESVSPPGRRFELAIRAVYSAGKASLSP